MPRHGVVPALPPQAPQAGGPKARALQEHAQQGHAPHPAAVPAQGQQRGPGHIQEPRGGVEKRRLGNAGAGAARASVAAGSGSLGPPPLQWPGTRALRAPALLQGRAAARRLPPCAAVAMGGRGEGEGEGEGEEAPTARLRAKVALRQDQGAGVSRMGAAYLSRAVRGRTGFGDAKTRRKNALLCTDRDPQRRGAGLGAICHGIGTSGEPRLRPARPEPAARGAAGACTGGTLGPPTPAVFTAAR